MSDNLEAQAELARLRASIDNLDAALMHILAERFRITDAVGRLKAVHDLPPQDPGREKAQAERLAALSKAAGLEPEIALKIHALVVSEATSNHRAIAARMKSRN